MDDVPAKIIKKKHVCLKLMKADNLEVLLIYCYSQRKFNCQNYFTSLNNILKTVIRGINANVKYEYLLNRPCKMMASY